MSTINPQTPVPDAAPPNAASSNLTPQNPAPQNPAPQDPPARPGRRSVIVLAVVAVVSLVAGMGLSRLIQSPAQAAANLAPPSAGPITYKVDKRVISNDVPLRAEVRREGSVELKRTAGAGDTGVPPVVTGHLPEKGSELAAGQVALEVAGRPVIALPGDLPVYRDLGAGMSGPDVVQLRAALRSLGIDAGRPSNDTYDATLAAGVRTLYSRAGYAPPAAGQDLGEAVRLAKANVTAAGQDVATAQRTLDAARRGATAADITAADGAVSVARAELAYWDAECPKDPEDRSPDAAALACTPPGRIALQTALDSAVAGRAALDTPPDTAEARAGLSTANRALAEANTALTEAQDKALTHLPASEVVYVSTLPRRVDTVAVERGKTLEGAFATVSGTELEARGKVAADDAEQLKVGASGTVTLDDEDFTVTLTQITDAQKTDGSTDASRKEVVFTFTGLTAEQEAALDGASSVRVKVPVGSTDGEVLAVPLAALSTGPDGSSRVQVRDKSGARLVEVTVGLAANGYVEIKSAKDKLSEGDLLVLDPATAAKTSSEDDDR